VLLKLLSLTFQMLNYDLSILQNYVTRTDAEKVVIAFQDSEAFDSGVLADLIYTLR
jgi:origin recognition complex subunit 3